ncbi:T9SS type A sorting domain-containing protein [bacterium SCSIO 12741]|nr:T9SS type A sorting domain-containing protein [bacterium SCSIO 12741]
MKKYLSLLLCGATWATLGAQNDKVQGYIDNPSSIVYTSIATEGDGLDSPVDLDFNPQVPWELWVINMRTENQGGSTVTIRAAGRSAQQAIHLVDGNAWHFMSLPTALAFGDNGAWGSAPGVYDANHQGGARPPFTGPSLWSADLTIYAQNHGPGTNGSHLDMLHESPRCMGMAWEKDNIYWVFDGEFGHPVMYDFAADHGPGQHFHGDGKVRRYPEVSLNRLGLIPSHMDFDKDRKWLYMNDVGRSRVLRMDITTGTVKGNSTFPQMEQLAEYVDMENVTFEVINDKDFIRPSGLAMDGDVLIISDNGSGELLFYDVSDPSFPLLRRIKVPYNDIMGITIGPEGRIWFVDKASKQLVRMDEATAALGIDETKPSVEVSVYPNPVVNELRVNISQVGEKVSMNLYNLQGQSVTSTFVSSGQGQWTASTSELKPGMYLLEVQMDHEVIHHQRILK